jgi:hypothetical protein
VDGKVIQQECPALGWTGPSFAACDGIGDTYPRALQLGYQFSIQFDTPGFKLLKIDD